MTLGEKGAAFTLAAMGIGVSYSLLNLGSGMIVGLRINAWMMFGCVLGWMLTPLLLINTTSCRTTPRSRKVLAWVLWPGLGMMVAGGMTTLVLRWRTLVRAFAGLRDASGEDVPLKWIAGGALALSIGLCLLQQMFFGLPIWISAVSIRALDRPVLGDHPGAGETN